MKTIALLSIVAFLIAGFSSCKMDNINPNQPVKSITSSAKSDTSTSLINNTALVGTWNIVTDTVSFLADTMYHGKAGDHYIFTKYGNVYARKTLNNFIDTGVYKISHDTVSWVSSYLAEGGGYLTKGPVMTPPYVISSLTTTSLILTSNMITPDGIYYEQIMLNKVN